MTHKELTTSNPLWRWPESGTESATIAIPNELAEIVDVWGELPDHIKQTIRTLVSSVTGLSNKEYNK